MAVSAAAFGVCLTFSVMSIIDKHRIGTIILQFALATFNFSVMLANGIELKNMLDNPTNVPTLNDIPDKAHIDTIMTTKNGTDTTYEYQLVWNDTTEVLK